MIRKFFVFALVFISMALVGYAQGQTSDQIQSLKDSLSGGSQGTLLEGVLGKGDGTGKKTDKKLDTPDTVQPKLDQSKDLFDNTKRTKTVDGRILRQSDEDPELRPDDTVLIELTSLDDVCNRYGYGPAGQNGNNGAGNTANNLSNANAVNGLNALNGAGGLNGVGNLTLQ